LLLRCRQAFIALVTAVLAVLVVNSAWAQLACKPALRSSSLLTRAVVCCRP
jgi:hypothetical protein